MQFKEYLQIIEMTQRLYRHIYGTYEKEMPEVDNMMKDALVLPSDKYYYRIRTLEEDLEARDAQIRVIRQESDAQINERDAQILALKRRLQEAGITV